MACTSVILSSPDIILPPKIINQCYSSTNFKNIKKYNDFTGNDDKERQKDIDMAESSNHLHSDVREKSKVLIVDDEPDLANLFKLGLESEGGFDVDVYNDPLKALSNYKPGIYDLLLLDVKMPNMNGIELYQRIREKDNKNDGTKACFITAFAEYLKEFERSFPNLEVDCIIEKPVSIVKLVEVVKAKLECYR